MNHRLLILGTLGEFVQLVQKAKQKGYYTIVCAGYPPGAARARLIRAMLNDYNSGKNKTEVVVSLHVCIVKENILYEITDKISCPVKWGGVLIIVKIIIKIDIQFFDILKLDVMINAVSNIHKNNNTDKCGAIKITMYAGHKN